MRAARTERGRAWERFERGDFDAARESFMALSHAGQIEPLDLQALYEILVDRREWIEAAAAIERALERWDAEPLAATIPWLTLLFDLSPQSAVLPDERRRRCMRLMEALAASNDAAVWLDTLSPDRLAAVESSIEDPLERIELFEQEAYAPDGTGFASRAKAMIEEVGTVNADRADVARAAARLLHAFGEAAAAYRVEHARRALLRRAGQAATRADETAEPAPRDLTVVVVGGHPALRALIERDLVRAGAARVRGLPSATEAVRSGRDIQATLAGADVVVLLARRIAHSTSDQVRRAAAKSGVPVVIAESAGIGGARRAIETFLASRPAT